ncbi:MAG: tetratricopeptide repeat protein, partial [Trueperaceae bacterium]
NARYFLRLAEDADRRLDTPEQPAALASLDAEHPDLVAALERAIDAGAADLAHGLLAALGRTWRWRGRVREGLHWAERAATLPNVDVPSRARIRARLAEGLLREKAGDYSAADRAFEEALCNAERMNDPGLQAAARTDRATVAWRRGDLATARELLDAAVATYRELGAEARLAGTLGNLGNVIRDGGDPAAAHARFDEALAIAERLGHVWEMANVRNNKAIAYAYQDDLEAARREFELALELQRGIDGRPGLSMALTNLGNVHLDTGDHDRARALYTEALSLCEEIGDRDGAAHLFVNLGILAQWGGDPDRAHELYGRSLRTRREMGARALAVQSVSCFLDLAVARGAHERALVLAGAVRALTDTVGVPLTARQQHVFDEALAAARGKVPNVRAADLERRGAGLSEREAISFALAERASA